KPSLKFCASLLKSGNPRDQDGDSIRRLVMPSFIRSQKQSTMLPKLLNFMLWYSVFPCCFLYRSWKVLPSSQPATNGLVPSIQSSRCLCSIQVPHNALLTSLSSHVLS